MVAECPKCGKAISDDSVYCPYCGHGIQPSARSVQVSVAGALMVAFTVASLVLFVLSFRALLNIHSWYPASVAQVWFVYDQMLTAISFAGLVFGLSAAILILTRRSFSWAMVSSMLGTLTGGGSWIISMVIPHSNIAYSILYYFLPLFATSLIGTLLIFSKKAEFNSMRSR
ncbi:MAG: zinc ribbon domain-containing protein [Candidatus Bathyarchaeota archaeon]|nr:zinc ribbon domain-containing protein [Candidatus Bathyarchaeota archaeon]